MTGRPRILWTTGLRNQAEQNSRSVQALTSTVFPLVLVADGAVVSLVVDVVALAVLWDP